MKKTFYLIVSLFLVVVIGFSCGCSACDKNDDPVTPSSQNIRHSVKMTSTGRFVIENGKSDYRIVYSENETGDASRLKFAREELQFFIKEATGVVLPIISDGGLAFSDDAKYISLGNTSLLESAGIEIDRELLGIQGVRIVTKGNTVFIIGLNEYAIQNAVYIFLQNAFNYDHYVYDYYIDTGMTDFELMDYDITEVPDVSYRAPGQNQLYKSVTLLRRMMYLDHEGDFLVSVDNTEEGAKSTSANHNALNYVPVATYNDPSKPETYHPKWFSDDGTQLCYTAHGDEAEYEALLNQILRIAKKNLIADTTSTLLPFSSMDVVSVCSCNSCKAALEQYGANSGAAIKLANSLYTGIMEWFNGEGSDYSRDNFKIIMLAYNEFVQAPVKINSEGVMEPTIKAEGISISFAPINMDWSRSIYDEANNSYGQSFKGWQLVTDSFSFWMYSTNYCNFYAPYNVINSLQENYKAFISSGADWLIDLGSDEQMPPCWQTLIAYLDAKLMWNVNIDFEYHVNKFFDMAYGNASETMKEVFTMYRVRTVIAQEHGFKGDCYMLNPYSRAGYDFWPVKEMQAWIEKFDYAIEQIEPIKNTDIYLYNELYKRIAVERVTPLFVLCVNYEADLDADLLNDYRNLFKKDCSLLGGVRAGAHPKSTYLIDYYNSWGI